MLVLRTDDSSGVCNFGKYINFGLGTLSEVKGLIIIHQFWSQTNLSTVSLSINNEVSRWMLRYKSDRNRNWASQKVHQAGVYLRFL